MPVFAYFLPRAGSVRVLVWLVDQIEGDLRTVSEQPKAPAGWYPVGDGGQRYWDGSDWGDGGGPVPPASTPPAAIATRDAKPGKAKGGLVGCLSLVVIVVIIGVVVAVATSGSSSSQGLTAQQYIAAHAKTINAVKVEVQAIQAGVAILKRRMGATRRPWPRSCSC